MASAASGEDAIHTLLENLEAIDAANPAERQSQYQGLVDWILEQPITVSRTLLVSLLTHLEQRSTETPPSRESLESAKQLAKTVIDKIAPRAVSYEDQLVRACEFLSGLYQNECAFQQAADTLARIDLESGMRRVDLRDKLDKYLKICHLYLEDGKDVGSADTFVKKASSLLSSLDEGKDRELVLQYLWCSARILDRKNKFAEAAKKYFDFSKRVAEGAAVLGTGKEEALESAIACALLADAGPQRSRLLAMLYKEEGVAHMETFGILEKVFLERLLLAEDVEAFSRALGGRHTCGKPGMWGLSIVHRAIVQHNLLGCSKLYSNITVSSLAELFDVDEGTALNIVAAMILDDRLRGSIDQVAGVVSFEVETVATDDGETSEGGANQVEEALALADAALAKARARYGSEHSVR